MDINKFKTLSLEELRVLYRSFLNSLNYKKTTVNTSYSDSFYLWKKESKDLFWNVVSSTDFESVAKEALHKALSENSTGNINLLVSGYMSHLRRFRLFLASDGTPDLAVPKQEKTVRPKHTRKKKVNVIVPDPSNDLVELYLKKWSGLENGELPPSGRGS